ncbi:CotS family spore coat protein [Paenibacillus sp.]|uniref:CotS family spore coat protein n=1 Tax=Paenibacillus sp. TaxID=58172 RepID=UPI002D419591|nr:CotS family spore coat protein [Paenibacillus sp.]HZG84334.1 CotS family spore coat protein [Paenibacillus sp.]
MGDVTGYDSAPDVALGLQLMAEHYPQMRTISAEVIQGGGIKTLWKLDTSQGVFCLKRIRKSIPIVDFTTAAQMYLRRKGALVADIVPTKSGKPYFVHEGYALVLYGWIEGTDLDMEEEAEHLEHGMAALGRFHRLSRGFVPPQAGETYDRMGAWPAHYAGMVANLKAWKQSASSEAEPDEFCSLFLTGVDRAIRWGELAIDLLARSCYASWVAEIGAYGYMCHQDYGKGNALLTERGVYVLDLDNLAYDIPLRDVRKLIAKRMEELGTWDADEIDRWVRVYGAEFPLTPEQVQVLYIDLLFPHHYYGICKNAFEKGKPGVAKKLGKSMRFEEGKVPVLERLLQVSLEGGDPE